MSSGDESGPNNIVSERETQFIPRSDDDEVLWDVQEITAERGKQYKVKWVGIDPATGKPWAQSWVAKHDCTDKLVAEWKAKKKRAVEKKRGRKSTTSRASGSSKRTGSITSGRKTRSSTSKVPSSHLDSVEKPLSPPPKKISPKRKQQFETLAITSNGAVQADEQSESSRPRKKQRTTFRIQLSPISSDEDEVGNILPERGTRAKVTLQNKVPLKSNGVSLDDPDEDEDEFPKVKGKFERGSDARPKGTAVSSRASDLQEVPNLPHSKKIKAVSRHKERVADADMLSAVSQDEELRPPRSKKKSTSKNKSYSERNDDLSEEEVELAVSPIKIGPPRGVKRQEALKESESSREPKLSRIKSTKPREDESDEEPVPRRKSERHPGNAASLFRSPVLSRRNMVDNPSSNSPSLRIPMPQVLPSVRLRSPDLSPGARARLQLFDLMMADESQPDASPDNLPEHPSGNTYFNYDDILNTHDDPGTFDPPHPLSPPPSKSKPKQSKLSTPNGLVVPETQSSGISQSQSQPPLKPPPAPQPPTARDQSPRKPIALPTIAVIAASVVASSASPQELIPPPQRLPPYIHRPSKKQTFKPVPQMSPNTFRSTINARSHVTESEAPPSSIESFTSPRRVDKGKQRAIEQDQLQSSLSEEVGGELGKRPTQRRITDSELKKRGKELFDQAQLTREADRQKKKKAKPLKTVDDIVNGTISSLPKGSPPLSNRAAEDTLDIRWEETVDLSEGMDSMTLDMPEHSKAKSSSGEWWERFRVELRQEEEENTQEAMGAYPSPPVKESEAMDVQMSPPRSPKNSPFKAQIKDVDRVEQPSVDLQKASVIVQASQEQRHEDTDTDPFPASQPRPIPQELTDSPKRKLGEALSLLNVKSEEIQRLERELADERKNIQGLKAELAEIQQSSEPTGPVLAAWEAERAQWTAERSKWENDLLEWQTQRKEISDEKANLSARVAELSDAVVRAEEVRVKLLELEAERDAWTKERDTMLEGIALRSEELDVLTKAREEYDQDRVKWEAEKASWAEERATRETERATLQEKEEALLRSIDELRVKVESMTAAKVSAEKDRDFFREQYSQASGFVGSVREENAELEKRVKIAERQAQEGVAGIKAFFEGRIEALQADVDRWRGSTELLQEKDRRTNDEVRLRAAQAPEFMDLCGRLDAENKSLRVDVRKIERAQQRSVAKRKKLYYEIFALKKKASLRSTLSRVVKMVDNSTQETSHSVTAPPVLEYPDSLDPNDTASLPDPIPQLSDVSLDEPALFPCMWRPQWRDQCQHIFDAKEDLERHFQDHFRDLLTQ